MNASREPERAAEFLKRLRAAMVRLGFADCAGRFAVAFSGGIDSSVLLAAMARLVPRSKLVALHVDHGLHPDSRAWAMHCAAFAARLGIEHASRRLELGSGDGRNIEARAREGRYAALATLIGPGDVVLTAHQADDQLETLLQRLFRGAGVRGLMGIHETAEFPPGTLLRPLLQFTRAEIRAQAAHWRLSWIEDPANRAPNFDRSVLREKLVPLVLERWPAAQRAGVRLARQMAQAEQLLETLAAEDAARIGDRERIACRELRLHGPARLSNLLRFLVRALELPMPSAVQLAELERAIAHCRAGTSAKVSWPGADARLYREHLYLLRPLPPFTAVPLRLETGRESCGGYGSLCLVEADGAGLPHDWVRAGLEVRFRRGGERFKPLGSRHGRPLKAWFQEAGIVPWMRGRIPLLYRDGELVAVADLALGDAASAAASSGPRWRVVWTAHPRVR